MNKYLDHQVTENIYVITSNYITFNYHNNYPITTWVMK